MRFTPIPAEKRVYDEPHNNRLVIGYFGSYQSSARNIMPLYEASKLCYDINFVFVGDSDIELKDKNNVMIIKRTTPDEVDRLMAGVDVVICLMNSKGKQIPGKIYNYACTNKEILIITDGENAEEIKKFFNKYDRFTFAQNSRDEIQRALQQYIINGIPKREAIEDFLPMVIAERMLRS